jgi:hypothetical protein
MSPPIAGLRGLNRRNDPVMTRVGQVEAPSWIIVASRHQPARVVLIGRQEIDL